MNNQPTKTLDLRRRAFTLIELLVVISIIGVLAAFTIVGLGKIKQAQYKSVAHAQLTAIQTALENFKTKYGAYPPGNANNNVLMPQLYYELSGTTLNNGNYATLDGISQIKASDVQSAYGVGGFINCTKGSGEDGVSSKNFLVKLGVNEYNTYITNNGASGNAAVRTTQLIYSRGGPDDNYTPLSGAGINPIRYLYPGTNNPGSYDLWVQLMIGGKKYLVCNWSRQEIINSPLP